MQDLQFLKDAIRMLIEDKGVSSDTLARMGSALDAEEKAAKAEFEKAVADLAAYDAENAKRQAYIAKLKELGKSADSAEGKKLRKDPAYNYNAKVLTSSPKRRDSLVAAVEKAKSVYGAYEPSAVEYKRASKHIASDSEQAEMPDKDAHVYMPIGQVKALRWYSWEDPRWSKVVKQIPYGGNAASGIGPGEGRLAKIFGGKVQGGSVSFDVVTPDGRKWEVKALESASDQIKPGTEGRSALDAPKKKLERIIDQMKKFVSVVDKIGVQTLATDPDDAKVLAFIDGFIVDEYAMFAKGEVSPERFKALRACLKALSLLKKKWSSGGAESKVDTTVSLGDKTVKVDKPTYIDVAKRVQRSVPGIDVLTGIEERELALSTLRDSAFEDPRTFLDDWYESVDINRIFEKVDGVFIVNSRGFNMVPKPLFKKAFRFGNISQGLPKFKFSYYDAE